MSAAEYALQPDSAALVVIDEINRGPAVQVFGSAIVGIERSKRKGPTDCPLMRPGSLRFSPLQRRSA